MMKERCLLLSPVTGTVAGPSRSRCSTEQFSLDPQGMLMGQHVIGWTGYRSEKGLVLGQRGGEEPPSSIRQQGLFDAPRPSCSLCSRPSHLHQHEAAGAQPSSWPHAPGGERRPSPPRLNSPLAVTACCPSLWEHAATSDSRWRPRGLRRLPPP